MPNEKSLSKSITLPKGQSTKKKTPSVTSSQSKRHSSDKLKSSNFSVSFMSKVQRHSRDKEHDLFKSSDQSNARETENFKHDHRMQRQMHEIVGATKSDGYERRSMSRQQPHATVESGRTKLQTEEDKLDNRHTYPDRKPSKIWYKNLWWELKKQARKVAYSNADADSSWDESISDSDEKQTIFHQSQSKSDSDEKKKIFHQSQSKSDSDEKKIFHQSQMKSIKTHATKRPFDSTRIKLEKNKFASDETKRPLDFTRIKLEKKEFASDENSILPSSEGVKIVSSDKVLYSKIVPATNFLSHCSSPKQDSLGHLKLLTDITSETTGDNDEREKERDSALDWGIEENEDTLLQRKDNVVQEEKDRFADLNLLPVITTSSPKIREKPIEDRDDTKLTPELILSLLSDDRDRDDTKLTPELILSLLSDDRINVLPEEVRRKLINRLKSIHSEDCLGHFRLLADITTSSLKTGEKLVENSEATKFMSEQTLSVLLNDRSILGYTWRQAVMVEEEHGEPQFIRCYESAYLNLESNGADVLLSLHQRLLIMQQDSLTQLKLVHEIRTSPGNTEKEPKEYKNATAGSRDKHESTIIKLYRNSIINEIYRVMISIGMVAAKAILLFGLKKTRIFFDLLDEKLFNFESPGIILDFVPNMAQYPVRQHVMSFFKHAGDSVEILTQLLLCCPDSESLQKMTEEEFIPLMQRVIASSSLKTKSNKGAKPSSKVIKGIKWIMVDSEEFVRAVGGEISEDIIYRRHRGDEMIVHRFIDTRHQPSDGRENRPYYSIFFPSDCRLFIYIPTENGSYWHQLDMRRAIRINQQDR